MKTIQIHKAASVTSKLHLQQELCITDHCPSKRGNVIVVKTLAEKTVYNELELTNGRLAHLSKGDIIVGALGARKALKGYVGVVPESIKVGDTLNILNMGGVIGKCTSNNTDVGKAMEVEVLGMVTDGEKILNIADKSLPENNASVPKIPLILISGTCMNSGKTSVACCLVQGLTQAGIRVAGVKVSGVACLRDVLKMADYGAVAHGSFLDCGFPSTVDVENLAPMARTLLNKLAEAHPDVIVIEMGDGIIGGYGVSSIFKDTALMSQVSVHIMCANDLVGAWGAVEVMKKTGVAITMFSGPATDNEVGISYIQKELGFPAFNSRNNVESFVSAIKGKVSQ